MLGCVLLLLRDVETPTILNCKELPYELRDLLKTIRRKDCVPPKKKALSRLREVEVGQTGHGPEVEKSTLRGLHKLAKIPGVRVVKADGVQYKALDVIDGISRKIRPTQIKPIHLHHCDVFIGHESWIFGAPYALEKFYFSSQPSEGQSWQALQVTTWLTAVICTISRRWDPSARFSRGNELVITRSRRLRSCRPIHHLCRILTVVQTPQVRKAYGHCLYADEPNGCGGEAQPGAARQTHPCPPPPGSHATRLA